MLSQLKEELYSVEDYGAFLSLPTLPCLFRKCAWQGKALGIHIAHAHKIPCAIVKALAGFNRRRGLVCASTRERMRANGNIEHQPRPRVYVGAGNRGVAPSAEAREAQARAMRARREHKACEECGTMFDGKPASRFCGKKCGNRSYRRRH